MNVVGSKAELKMQSPNDYGEFLGKSPIYSALSFQAKSMQGEVHVLNFLQRPDITFDSFCPSCNDQTTYRFCTSLLPSGTRGFPVKNYVFGLNMVCARDENHQMHFLFRVDSGVLLKLGQYPSAFDTNATSLRAYRKVLSADRVKDFKLALGGISSGIGAGSLIYLRRIFEGLVEEAKIAASADAGWDEEKYKSSRMAEKITILKDRLPPYLVENKRIYGIMSAGIHNLSEEQCLTMIPVIQAGIELILDERLVAKEREEKANKTKVDIQKLDELVKTLAGELDKEEET